MKKITILTTLTISFIFCYAQTLTLSQNTTNRGQRISISFSGTGVNFSNGSSTTQIYFQQGSGTIINPDSTTVSNSSLMWGSYPVSASTPTGLYDAVVFTSGSSTLRFANKLTVTNGVGIQNPALKNNLIIYPNPTQNNINVKSDFAISEITIYNVLGIEISNQKCHDVLNYSIDVSSYSKGKYIMNIKTKEGNTQRIFDVN